MSRRDSSTPAFLFGGGEMGALIRSFDWSTTSLGPPETWPLSLRNTVGILLNAQVPMFLWWGDDLIQFYNDAYRPSLGSEGKHPLAVGQRGADCWPEIWPVVNPLIEQVRAGGPAIWREDQLIPIVRNGRLEDVYWTFGYSAVMDESGRVGGVLVVCQETTEKVRVFRQVESSQEQFHTLFQQAPVGIAILRGPEHTFELANDFYVKIIGRQHADEILGKPFVKAVPEIEDPGFAELLTQLARTGEAMVFTEQPVRLIRQGQPETGYFNFTWQPLPAPDSGVLVVAVEVTESVLARQKIEESENRLSLAIETAELGTWEYDPATDVITCSERTVELFGFASGETVTIERILNAIVDADRQRVADAMAAAMQPESRAGGRYEEEYSLINYLDGQRRTIRAKGKAFFGEHGMVKHFTGTVLDITEARWAEIALRESDRWFRQLADSMPQMVWTARPDGFLDYYNRRWYDFTGFEEGYGDQSWIPILHPDDVQSCVDTWYHSVQTGEPYQIEYRFRDRHHPDTYCWFLGRATPFHNEQGEIIKWFGTCTDIDNQKRQAERLEELVDKRTQELRESNLELERSNLDLMQFAYVASHDLKEPLRKIQMFGSLLERELATKLTPREKQHLDVMTTASGRMQLLVEDVLNLSRLSQRDIPHERVDLNQIVGAITDDLQVLIREKNARVEMGTLPVLRAVPGQMHQLFQNLISNGLKFNESPTPTVSVSVGESTLTHVVIDVRDNGIGFAEEFREKMFGMFQRLNGRQYAGTGIGLTICRKIVENHRGRIEAESVPGEGATFRVTLPVA